MFNKRTTHEFKSQLIKDHKNSGSSHQEPPQKGGKMGLYGHTSRTHANQELLNDAFDLAEAQEEARSYSPR